MVDLKTDFRNWLVNVKKLKQPTAQVYVGQLTNIYKENFSKNDFYLTAHDWNILNENLLPLLIKYYEFSNKEYFLDRVTIWHALDYFSQVIGYINSSKQLTKDNNQTVKLYFYCYEGDFYIDSVNFESLEDYVHHFNSFCYRRSDVFDKPSTQEIRSFLNKIREVTLKGPN